ncbi:MAG: protein-disulfide reductase DsbD domain-containing protein [Halofilum sp. (in: g-proteobacteria)]
MDRFRDTRLARLLTVVGLAALVLTGCGDGSGGATAQQPSSDTAAGDKAPGLEIEGVDGGTAASGKGALESDSKVEVSARVVRQETDTSVLVRVTIDDGWHINANPASLDFLVPTSVTLHADDDRLDVEPVYPESTPLSVPLGDGAIQVYEQTATIRVPLPADVRTGDLARAEVMAEVQACNDEGRCLAPSTIAKSVDTTGT